ncbi:MAG: element excision factor XisH family protein [Pirellulaceae bacterium]
MPAKNIHHDVVIEALKADGWTITHDPLTIEYGGRNLFVDLGAERATIGAEKGTRKIAVEIQSFMNPSAVRDLEETVGQYSIYRTLLHEDEPERTLYLAVPRRVREEILGEPLGQLVIERLRLLVLVFSEEERRVIEWIN